MRVKTLYSAISRGTESLVFGGRVPESEFDRMRAPFMAGDFPFPVKYGYAAVGRIESGSDALRGKTVFALYPHQTAFNIPAERRDRCFRTIVPPQRAVLAANMETALNGVWDAAPGPADRIAVVGAGVVGSLVAYLCGRLPGADVTLVDINPARAELAGTLGVGFAEPADAKGDCDLVVHASGSPDGLRTALELAGDEATVLEMSWYGDTRRDCDAWRPLPQPPASAGIEPGRTDRPIASSALDARPPPRGRHRAAQRSAARCIAGAAGRFRDLPKRLPEFSTPEAGYSANPSSTRKELPCSPSKFATTS